MDNNSLDEIKEETFNIEKTIQNLIENNLDSIFSGLEFIASEFPVDDLRPDTIAFDSEKRSFVIIEYKNIQNRSLIDQGVSYYQLLRENAADFVLRYNNEKNKTLGISDINWDETRIIFISPKYTKYQKRVSGFMALPIEFYEIKKYQNNVISLNKLGDFATQNTADSKTKKPKAMPPEYVESEYLDGKYIPPRAAEKTRDLWFRLKEKIEDTFDDVVFKQRKAYGGYYLRDLGSSVCILIVSKKDELSLNYSTRRKDVLAKSNFVKDLSNSKPMGIGSFYSYIESVDDIEEAVPFIRQMYEFRKFGSKARTK